MSSFGAFLLQREAASMADLEESMRRQMLYGGDIGVHLLGQGVLDEGALLLLLGQYHQLPLGPVGSLPPMPEVLEETLPLEVLRRYRVLPLRLGAQELRVATAQPLDDAVLQELAELAGQPLRQVLVTQLRLMESLWRYLEVPLPAVYREALAQLDGPDAIVEPERPTPPEEPKPYRRMIEDPVAGIVPAERVSVHSLMSPSPFLMEYGSEPEEELGYEETPQDDGLVPVYEQPVTLRNGSSQGPEPIAVVPEFGDRPSPRGPFESEPPEIEVEPADVEEVMAVASEALLDDGSLVFDELRAAIQLVQDPGVELSRAAEPRVDASDAEALGLPPGYADTAPGIDSVPSTKVEGQGARRPVPEEQESRADQPAPGFLQRGPLSRQAAERAVSEAADVSELLEILMCFACQHFQRLLLFVVQGDQAAVRLSYGVAATLESLQVSLKAPSVLKRAYDDPSIVIERPLPEGVDALLLQGALRDEPIEVVVIPLRVRRRVVALLYADDSAQRIDRDRVAEVGGFANIVGNAMALQILRRKRLDGE